jgi:PAS domain S-box-containing protein
MSFESNVVPELQTLTEVRERLDIITATTHDGIWEWDLEEATLSFSMRWREMMGYGPEDLDLKRFNWRRIVHPDDVQAVENAVRAHISGETAFFESIHRNMRKDGRYIWVHSRGKAMRDANGRLKGILGLERDVTMEKDLQQELAELKTRLNAQ